MKHDIKDALTIILILPAIGFLVIALVWMGVVFWISEGRKAWL